MILYIGDEKYKKFLTDLGAQISEDETAEAADKIIITVNTPKAVEAAGIAAKRKIPFLAVLDGTKALISAFGGETEEITCHTGAQEWAVIDATSPVYVELESVIKICRGPAFAIVEETKPVALDCMSRCETGEIIALRNFEDATADGTVIASAPKKYGNIYGINFDLTSDLTPDGTQIMKNFLAL